MWIVVGPGLATPACIDVHSRTVYLDSDELIGSQQEILAGNLDRYRIRVCFGAAFHEVGHAKHTLRFVIERYIELDRSGEGQLALDYQLLEEPRMEAHLFADYPPTTVRGRFVSDAVRAAVASVILPRFAEQVQQAGPLAAVTRDMCGRAMTYLAARTHYEACDAAHLQMLEPIWEQVLGLADIAALHHLYARLILVPDGNTDAMEDLAREYREIIGQPDPAPLVAVLRITRGEETEADGSASGPGQSGPDSEAAGGNQPGSGDGQGEGEGEDGAAGSGDQQGAGAGSHGEPQNAGQSGDAQGDGGGGPDRDEADGPGGRSGGGSEDTDNAASDTAGDQQESGCGGGDGGEDGPGDGPTLGSLADALRDAAEHARAGQLEQFDEDVSLEDVLDRAASLPSHQEDPTGQGTGAPSGRMPDRGVDRPPMPDEVRAANVFASRLERARTASVARIDKRTPGGRFNSRQYVRALAQRQHGRPITAFPWSVERRKRNPIRGPHVIFIVDTSGSMARYEYALGPIVWIIDSGLRKVGGRMATGLFGDSAESVVGRPATASQGACDPDRRRHRVRRRRARDLRGRARHGGHVASEARLHPLRRRLV